MKLIKPRPLGFLQRIYTHRGVSKTAVAVLVGFGFDQPDRLLSEVAIWKLVAAELGPAPLDECIDKRHAEVLVHGACHTPGGKPVSASSVRVTIGSVDRTIDVIGDRVWKDGVPTEPEAFTSIAIDWAHAFGGEAFADNPLGKGHGGEDGTPLPNLEEPGKLITAPDQEPPPANFGGIPFAWPARLSRVGTYDEAWQKNGFPGFADDVDWRLFNLASEGQWADRPFKPGEAFTVERMHPDHTHLESRLPQVVGRCFVNRRRDGELSFEEVPLEIDTVHLFPHLKRGIVIHRGVVDACEDDAADIAHIVVAGDAPGALRDAKHYQAVLAERLDPPNPEVLLLESPLLPPDPGGEPLPEEDDGEPARDGLLLANRRRGVQKEVEEARERIAAQGGDPSELADVPDEEPVPTGEDIVAYAAKIRAQAADARQERDEKQAENADKLRAICAEQGIDYDELVEKTKGSSAGPPTFSAQGEYDKLAAARDEAAKQGMTLPSIDEKLADEALWAKMRLAEKKLGEMYLKTAHLTPGPRPLDAGQALALRDDLVMRATAGVPVAGRNLTGADLSGLKLAGANLAGAFLEGADLSNTDLEGANLDRTVLAHANLRGANLRGASLERTNLGGADLRDVDASGAKLVRTELSGANLTTTVMKGATLDKPRLHGAELAGVDWTEIDAEKLRVLELDLSGTSMRGANLTKAVFLKAKLDGVDLSNATLTSATVLEGGGEQVVARGATAINVRVVQGAALPGIDLEGADLTGANLRDADLAGANLNGCRAESADMSGANLEKATMQRLQAKRARFARTNLAGADLEGANLMEASLHHTNARSTSFKGSNLFRADIAHLVGDDDTSFEDALLNRVRVVAARKTDAES